MCGPSSQMKQINQSIQAFGNKVTDEAGTIFGEANGVFNDIKNAVTGIIKGGPSQMGMSAAEHNARTAAIIQNGATENRNLRGAAAAAVGAIGGGNVVTPAGSTQAITMSAEQKAAADTAAAQNQLEVENAELGRENFWNATKADTAAVGTLNAATDANKVAMSAQQQQLTSQQNIDTQNNWWQPLVEKGVMAGVDAFTGGIGGSLASKIMPKSNSSNGNTGFLPSDQGGWGDQGSSSGDTSSNG
jgi:hypothetical protein